MKLSQNTPPVTFSTGDSFLKQNKVFKSSLKEPLSKPIKSPTKLEGSHVTKTAGCDDLVARAKKSRIPVPKKNKYLEKVAVSTGFKFVSSTSGMRKLKVRKPSKPGLMKVASASSVVRNMASKAGTGVVKGVKGVGKGIDYVGGAGVTEYGRSHVRGSVLNEKFTKAKSFSEKSKIVQEAIKKRPAAEQKKIMGTLKKKRVTNNIVRGAVGTGAAAYTGDRIGKNNKRKAQERAALQYYRQRGLI